MFDGDTLAARTSVTPPKSDVRTSVAESVRVMAPVRISATVGLNTTLTEQLNAGRKFEQLVEVMRKSPLSTTRLKSTATVPTFVITICFDGLVRPTEVSGNTSDPGVIDSVLVAATPFPVSVSDRGLAAVLSRIVSMEGHAPVAAGVKLTLTVHDAPGFKLPQEVVAR